MSIFTVGSHHPVLIGMGFDNPKRWGIIEITTVYHIDYPFTWSDGTVTPATHVRGYQYGHKNKFGQKEAINCFVFEPHHEHNVTVKNLSIIISNLYESLIRHLNLLMFLESDVIEDISETLMYIDFMKISNFDQHVTNQLNLLRDTVRLSNQNDHEIGRFRNKLLEIGHTW